MIGLLAFMLWQTWQTPRKSVAELRPADPPPPPPPPPAGPTWHSLPGNQLELGATGWRITLDVDRPDCDLILWTPEGRCSATGREWQLDQLKRHAELCAGNRAEFAATASTDWRL